MGKELRILMLEDTPTDAELMEHELRKAGIAFNSMRVETRAAFVRALEEFRPDIILSDYHLPDFDGMAALQLARRDYPQVPVIMVTGALADVEAVELLHAGAKDYVLKDRLARLAPAVQRTWSTEEGIRARKAAEEKIRKISESALDAIIMMGPDRCISFWNAAAERIFGYTAAEAMGQEMHALLAPPPAQAAFAQGYAHFLESGEGPVIGKVLELTGLRKGGAEFPVELSISAAHLNGQWHAIGIARDITERKRGEEALRQSEAAIRAIIEHSPIAMLVDVGVEADEKIIMMNQKFTELFGYTLDDVPDVGHWWPLAYPDEKYREALRKEWIERVEKAILNHSDIAPMEATVACKDGSNRYARISFASIGNRNIVTFEDLTGSKQAEAELLRLNRTLRAISASNHALVHGEDEKALLETMCRATTEVGYALAWVGYAMQDDNKSIVPMAVSGHGKAYVETLNITWDDQPLGRGPTGAAVRTGQTQIVHDIKNDPRMEPWREAAMKYGYASSIALPLLGTGQVIGALTIYAVEPEAFGPDQVALLEEMASDLAFGLNALHIRHERDLAMEQDRKHFAQLQDNLEDTVRAIAGIVEMRDPYTAGHQARVADLASAIARQMGLPGEQVHAIHLAGVVHDLGKIQVPAEILSKPGKISDIELSLIKTHAQAGYDILKGISFPWPVAQMVWQHHERLDGSGYPQGLKGDQIILEARILAVADVVEAMWSHRPYRHGLGIEAALGEITRSRGKLFDPQAVDACVALFREQGYKLAV